MDWDVALLDPDGRVVTHTLVLGNKAGEISAEITPDMGMGSITVNGDRRANGLLTPRAKSEGFVTLRRWKMDGEAAPVDKRVEVPAAP